MERSRWAAGLVIFTDKQLDDLMGALDRDVARCNRWVHARMVSRSEKIESQRLLQSYNEIRVTLKGMKGRRR